MSQTRGSVRPALPVDAGTLRIGLVLGGAVLALLAGFGLGRLDPGTGGGGGAPGPGAPAAAEAIPGHVHPSGAAAHDHGAGPDGSAAPDTGGAGAEVGGVTLSAGGYTLVADRTQFPAGRSEEFRFRIRGADGRTVTSYAVVHDKPMHLIVARRDLSGYQHLHPALGLDGTWSVPLTLPEPGSWRAYADFTAVDATGRQTALTLGVDLVVPGDHAPRALPPAARTATLDGLTVEYQGTPRLGAVQPLLFRVSRGGVPVTDLQPYLGAYGHLVALREGDLGYLHVHPEPQLADGGVKFWLTAPSPGRYRLFFDFQLAGTVRTAEFTLVVP
ncbi:hypothetical protein AB0J86_26840 [Micromonospora sp. NPDC049559]|uniref:hypothetical protein n=1 Tax=Micromonospora sp. NPDC049559 TaxID=3155923 RepID=UPI0034258C20